MISPSNPGPLAYPYFNYMPQTVHQPGNLMNSAAMQPITPQPNLIDPNFALGGVGNNLAFSNLILPMRSAWAGKQLEKKADTTGKLLRGGERFSPYLTSKLTHEKNHFHIFVGDLCQELEVRQLRDAFSVFGEVSDAKIIKDTQTGKSKGYGFVSFINKEEAQKAINDMNGAWLGSRAVRTNWAVRKPPAPIEKPSQKLNYDEVFGQSSATNFTVYIGGIQSSLTEELMKEIFKPYGSIQEVRIFQDKGFAFVRFDNKESACKAIIEVNGQEVGGFICKCSWGKESNDHATTSPNYSHQLLSQLNAYNALQSLNQLNVAGLTPQPHLQPIAAEQLAYPQYQQTHIPGTFPYGGF